MIITPDIIRREFIGTHGLISTSTHAGYLGISGPVLDETKNTFVIQHEGKTKNVIKDYPFSNSNFVTEQLLKLTAVFWLEDLKIALKKQ
jgi:RNase P/RNase MRP subunit p29